MSSSEDNKKVEALNEDVARDFNPEHLPYHHPRFNIDDRYDPKVIRTVSVLIAMVLVVGKVLVLVSVVSSVYFRWPVVDPFVYETVGLWLLTGMVMYVGDIYPYIAGAGYVCAFVHKITDWVIVCMPFIDNIDLIGIVGLCVGLCLIAMIIYSDPRVREWLGYY